MKNNKKYHSLSRRIVAHFCIFTLIISAIYGFFSFLFMWNLEDDFFKREITQEANYLNEEFQRTGEWPDTRNNYMTIYFSEKTLPSDMKQQFFEESSRPEFYGEEGRHYHLHRLIENKDIYLVAEVSERLLVRPIRPGVFQFLLINGLVLTIIACVIAWLLGRKTAKPLRQLAELVDGVAPENIPESFAHKFPNNEIGILAQTLEDSMRRINQALEREKCFTRDVSHELRTPVAIVKNATEVYQEKSMDKEQMDNLVNRITEASVQMEQTVTTLLMLAREEQTSVDKQTIKLLPLVEQSIIDNSHLIGDKPIEVNVNDNCNTAIHTQPGMLKVLLDNLLANAFQYTELGEVRVSFLNGQLSVEDTGPGIEKDLADNVTEPAIKGSQSTGYGFGLSIVKRLCEHQHWLLSVESERGTKISVSFEG